MEYSHRYCAYPNDGVAAALHRHIDIHRQAYNHTRWEYTTLPEDTDTIGSAYKHHDRLTDWKDDYPLFSEVHSKALQRTVTRFYNNLSILKEKKKKGYTVGWLNWKSPREYQSITYSQSGFKLKNTSGQTATLWLSKIGDIPLRYHRPLPDEATIKEVTVKHETTGEWFVSFALDVDGEHLPDKKPIDEIEPSDCVGVDLGSPTTFTLVTASLSGGWTLNPSTNADGTHSERCLVVNIRARTGRTNASESRRLHVGFVGKYWTSNINSRHGLSPSTMRCSLRIWT
jgi:putative transposase